MADDVERKPKFILNKQKPEMVQASVVEQPVELMEKKKVVVVKKKPFPSPSPVVERPPQTVVKVQAVAKTAPTAEVSPPTPVSEKERESAPKPALKPVTSFELSPQRPNSKQGNLADRPRPPRGGNGQHREGGFTGAQAREGYQNRSSGGGQGYQGNRPDGGQGYQGGGGQGYQGNRPDGGQGYQGGGGQGYQGNRPTGGQGYQGGGGQGYQGNRPTGGQGYQGGGGQGYQGNRPTGGQGYQGGGQGYQGNRPTGGQGYQGGGGQGYQGNRPTGGYQGGPGGSRPGGYQGGRPGGFSGPRPGFGASPSGSSDDSKKLPVKKTFKAKKPVYTRRDREDMATVNKMLLQRKKQIIKANPVPKEIEIMETVSVSELAKKMNLKASEIIARLMAMGMMVSITQSIDADTAILVASEYECEVKIISLYDETVIESQADVEADMFHRPPVVTIMGHVDHGKTKTLDAIRSANVVASEFGGITQHIGAYMVETSKGAITFLDTPGHEAFSMMRARGAKVTDIVVLVVAADDGVMPQTVEAISHARDAKVPIIVAINKIDKPEANLDRVKTELSKYNLTPEDWGGQTQFVYISALRKEGLDDLLDAILLQSEVLELQANWNCRAEGKVIESRIDQGRGIVSTIIVERGTLRTGDSYVAGVFSGRVRAIFNDHGEKIDKATPSMPVEILGFEGMPNAGDPFQVTENEREARAISSKRQELRRFEHAKTVKKVTLDNLYDTISDGSMLELKVVIKADVQGSAEALKESLEKLSTSEIRLTVIHSSAGAINESDVNLASADSNAIIIGFNVRPTPKAKQLADQDGVDIRKYNIIYKAVEEIQQAMEGMLKPDLKEEVIGSVEVRNTFKVPKIGVISGCYVLQGLVKRTSSANLIRDGIVIHTGKISSLKRFKDDAKEVAAGFECGIGIDNWQDVRTGDQFEVFEMIEVARKLSDSKAEAAAEK